MYLDASVPGAQYADTPRLTPFAHHIYHNRNRSYHPTLGRFLQADPNASGLTVASGAGHSGSVASDFAPSIDIERRYTDGGSLYQYVRSNPVRYRDPLGLYSGEDAFEDFSEVFSLLDPIPGPSDFLRSVINGLVTDYSNRLDWDVDWASDWGMPDDTHSRLDSTWVIESIANSLMDTFTIDIPFSDAEINPLGPFARASGGGASAGKAGHEHHIMTNKNRKAELQWTLKFEKIFKDRGIPGNPLNWPENKLIVPGHEGPHSAEYHKLIHDRVRIAIGSKRGPQAEAALRKELLSIKADIQSRGAKAWGLHKAYAKPNTKVLSGGARRRR